MRFRYLAVGIALLVAIGIWQVRAGQEPGAKPEGGQDTADLAKHGDYLVNCAVLCGDCHTPRDSRGQPDQSRRLQGAMLGIAPKQKTKDWAEKAPDITSGGLAGKWSEEELAKFLMTGTNPGGEKATEPMPAFRLNARDARAVTLYLRSLPGKKGNREKEDGGKGVNRKER